MQLGCREVLGSGGRAVAPAVPYGMRDGVAVVQVHDDGGEGDSYGGWQGQAVHMRAVVSAGPVLMLRSVLMLR